MTTISKDIELLLANNHIPYNITTLGWMLKKLDNEDLDVLYSILQHIEADDYELQQEYRMGYDEGYDKGYSDGYSNGYATEE